MNMPSTPPYDVITNAIDAEFPDGFDPVGRRGTYFGAWFANRALVALEGAGYEIVLSSDADRVDHVLYLLVQIAEETRGRGPSDPHPDSTLDHIHDLAESAFAHLTKGVTDAE